MSEPVAPAEASRDLAIVERENDCVEWVATIESATQIVTSVDSDTKVFSAAADLLVTLFGSARKQVELASMPSWEK